MLQKIEAKVQAEGEAETELHEKAMCECKNGIADYTQSISDGEAKVESLAAGLESGKGSKSQLESDLASHKADREAAKQALAEATSMREKEAAAFAGTKAESEANIAAVNKAVKAIEKGAAGAFLQTDAAQTLRDLASSDDEVFGDSRQEVIDFLSTDTSSAGSGEIVGIMKQLSDEMIKDLGEATGAEEKAIANYNELTQAKNGEVAALTKSIEDKITRLGETGVQIADMKNDAKDTAGKLVDDKQFLVNLQGACTKREADWEAVSKERQAELVALADTIKMLNDDDALELFKKTLPSASSFLQLEVSSSALRAQALDSIHASQKKGRASRHLDLIALALHGKTADMSKVIQMIDEMVGVLKQEQTDDDTKKEWCTGELDSAEDKLKGDMQLIKDTETSIADAKETVNTLSNEITMLVGQVAMLDKDVATATEERKKENAGFKELRSSNGAAKELIEMAKKRLNKFYNPSLMQVNSAPTAFLQMRSSEVSVRENKAESAGVIAMLDTLVGDLDKETAVATADEKDAQADYEKFMSDSKGMRAENGKLIQDKSAAKADSEGALQRHSDDLETAFTKMKGSNDQLKALHEDCDWLLQNYDARKEARADEIDALGKAKAVLSGADFVQE
jgi:chromosome segregation ATPase